VSNYSELSMAKKTIQLVVYVPIIKEKQKEIKCTKTMKMMADIKDNK
jgi:hypothetical protein